MRAETERLVEDIERSLALLRQRLGDTAEHRLEELNAMSEDPELWSDPARAQKLMRDRQMLSDALDGWRGLAQELADQKRADRARRGRGRRRGGRRRRGGDPHAARPGGGEGDRGAARRRGRRQRHLPRDQRRRRRHRELRLGGDARAHVRALGRGARHEGRADRREPGRGGRHPFGHLPGQRRERLRLAEVRERRPPPRAHLALRQRRAAAHLVLLGLGLSGGRRQYRDRHPAERHPHRHLSLVGRRRPARQHDELGGAHHPPAHQHRGDLLGEVAAPEPRQRDGRAEVAALRARAQEAATRRSPRSTRPRATPAGATRSGATCCSPTRW